MPNPLYITCWGLLGLCLIHPALADTLIQGRVARIMSGDHLLLISSEDTPYVVRLQGITAPDPARAPGRAAKRSLEMLLAGKPVTLKYKRRNEMGQVLGTVTLGGMDAALRQLKRGMARYLDAPTLNDDQRQRYRAAEQKAKDRGLGLWNGRRPPFPR